MENLRNEYIEWCRDVKGLAPKTIQASLEAFCAFFDRYGGELTLDSFEGYIAWMKKDGLTVQTIVSRGGHIKRLVKYAKRKGLCEDFTDDIVLPRIHFKPPTAIRIEDADKAIEKGTEIIGSENNIIKHNKKEVRAALKFCLRTGLRKSELLALKPEHVRIDEKVFFVVTSKSYKTVPMPIPLTMLDEIKRRMKQKCIFEPSDPGVMNDYLKRGCKRAGIDKLTCHDLRDAFCMDQLRRGIPPQTVKELMRHADFSSLARYSAALIEEKALAINSSSLTSVALEAEDILEMVKKKILSTGIMKNQNVKAEMIEKGGEFVFRIVT